MTVRHMLSAAVFPNIAVPAAGGLKRAAAGRALRHSYAAQRWLLLLSMVAGLALAGPRLRADEATTEADVDQRIARLIQDLGDNQFAVRQRAQRELTRLGHTAFDALSAAENSDDVEVATQARYLVRLIRIEWTQDGDSAQIKQILGNYEAKSEPERLELMKQLAGLSGDAGVGPLCRLARFEASPLLSKQAAVLILKEELPPDADWQRRSKAILQSLDRSARPAAQWLRAYVQSHDDPAAGLVAWHQLADAERRTLEEHPQQTQNQLVQELLRQQVNLLDRLQKPDEALAVIRKIIDLERGDPQTLTELVEWLEKRQAWGMIDEVASRFNVSFAADAELLYTLAQARLAQGNEALAEETAQKALQLNADKSREHIKLAIQLQKRGLIQWADREYRYVISLGLAPGNAEEGLLARLQLSENLHDRQEDKEAGMILEGALKAMDSDVNVLRYVQRWGKSPDSIRSRMGFFFAENARRTNDNAKAIESLEKALGYDPADADVLIALYRLPLTADRRKKLLETIREAVEESRKEIVQHPEEATAYNQLAWLVANTEGDLDEATRLSHKSIELKRAAGEFSRAGGYLDTLAHCYYAKRDYANAVKFQTEAAKLEPSSQAIARQLKVFRAALAKQQGNDKTPGDKSEEKPNPLKKPSAGGGEPTGASQALNDRGESDPLVVAERPDEESLDDRIEPVCARRRGLRDDHEPDACGEKEADKPAGDKTAAEKPADGKPAEAEKPPKSELEEDGDLPQVQAIMAAYPSQKAARRLPLIAALAAMPRDSGVGPLCRVVRFEASPFLSRTAAWFVLQEDPTTENDWPQRKKAILQGLQDSECTGAEWLRAYVQSHDDAAGVLPVWERLITTERALLRAQPEQTRNQFVRALMGEQVKSLYRLKRRDEALAAIGNQLELEPSDAAPLTSLVTWLTARQDWPACEAVAAKFGGNFKDNAAFLYTLAESQLAKGTAPLAEESAKKAFAIDPDNARDHVNLAMQLQRRGLVAWADREYRHVIGIGRELENVEAAMVARLQLSENLHDRQQDNEAAEVLQGALKAMGTYSGALRMVQRLGRDFGSVRARVNFFSGEHARNQHDNAKALEYLENALQEEPLDADVLIAMYRLPLEGDKKKKLADNIKQAVDELRKQIERRPDDPGVHNQLAWLIANTEGDLDEATRCAQKSVELTHSGGYLDTLAHCYYAQHDYASAVKCEVEAAQLEPGSQAIARQLKMFRDAQARQPGGAPKQNEKPEGGRPSGGDKPAKSDTQP